MASAVLALVGLIIYLQGSTLPGVLLLIIGIAVAMICSTMLKFMSWYDYPWLLNGKGKRERSRLNRRRNQSVSPGPQNGARRAQYLLLSAGWCFLKQSLQ